MFSSQFSLICSNSTSFWWHPHPSILPNPGQCARLVIFAWIPLLFFLLLSPAFALQLWRVRKKRNNSLISNPNAYTLPFSSLLIAKFVICLILIILASAQLFKLLDDKNDPIFVQFPWQSILASIAKMANLLCLFIGHRFSQLHGIVSAGILHLTWVITFLCSFPDLYSVFQHFLSANTEPTTSDSVHLSIWVCWSLALSIQCSLFFFADPRHPTPNQSTKSLLDHSTPIFSDSICSSATKISPELDSSFFSRLTYFWFRHLPSISQQKDLTFDDLYDLNEGSRSQHLIPQWERSWLPAVERYYQKKMEILAQQRELGQLILNGGKKVAEMGEFGWTDQKNKKQIPKKPSVIFALFKMFKWELISSGLIKAFADILQFANPFLLRQLITFVGAPDAQLWQGLSLAIAMFVCSEIRSLCINHYFFVMFQMGTKIQTTLTAAIYKKSLQLSNSARRERNVGEIVNLMAIDVERFQMITPQIQQFWSSPLQIALALVFLFNTLGIAAIPGVVIMSIIIPLSFVSSFLTRRWQIKQMQQKDERTKLCNEILNGMKVIKLYAWEWPMIGAIERIRAKELGCLLKAGLVRSVIDTLNFTSPFLVAIGSFITFCWLNPSSLTPQIAFVSLTLFNQLRSPMTMIGFLINMIVQTAVSNQRIKEFLLAEELDQNAIEKRTDIDDIDDIKLVDADFSWDNSHPTFDDAKKKKIRSQTGNGHKLINSPPLQNINLNVQNGQLIAIVGKVGAGKSSLLASLLGEMQKLRGRMQIRQGISIAYVPQQPWIQNMSLRQNVTFGREFCAQFYGSVLDACALTADLSMLPQGDATEIGEKGINLSGGQKARVALARAVYSQSSLYLFDDPLSAVDSHVGKWIFDKVIGPEGMLADRSRLLVTHRLHFLLKAHKIVFLDESRIVECGTFEELAAFGGKFAELIAEGNLAEGGQEEEEENEMNDGETKMIENEEMEGKGKEMLDSAIDDELTLTSMEQIDKLTHQISRQSSSQPNCHRRRQSQITSVKSGQNHHENNGEGKLIDKERVETGRVKIAVYLEYMRAAGFTLSILFIFLFCVNQGMQIGRSFWLSAWADENDQGNVKGNGTIGGESDDEFRLAIYGVFGIFEALFFFFSLIALQFCSLFGSRNLHSPMLLRIIQAPMAFFDTTPIGRLLNRFGKDIEVADTILPLNIRYFVHCLTIVFATLLTICISTWVFGLVILPLFLFYYFTLRLYVPVSRQMKRLESSHRSPIYSHFGESIQGASSIRAFGRCQQFCMKMEHRVDGLIRIKYLSLVANRWLAIRLELLGNCVVLFSALFGALSREWSFVSSAGLVGLSLSYALNITEVMNFAIRQISELETNIVSIERLKEYAEVETEAPWEIPDKKPPKGWPNIGEIRFAQYSTRYRAGLDLVLRNIQAEIRPAERIGIVGRTGAGKSSLTLALFRMVEPARGTIYIDGIDITQMGLHDLRSGLTIIPQEPVLFSGNLRFNLDPFNRHSDSEIWQALENSHLHDFIQELPAGLEYQINEGGENISVGQRQLLCLARALLRSTRILVLDEATASVDLSTDALIQETIRQKFRHCTVLTIAHRLETIMDYDRIMVLQQGQICEFDSPQILLANRNSLFYSMVKDAIALNGTTKYVNTK